jgi:hypothetical protein
MKRRVFVGADPVSALWFAAQTLGPRQARQPYGDAFCRAACEE